ncbi:MAG: 4Fe-4S ferredoxin [Candidatus Lokiarchaeota archaeon]|nr:4Fe-4S ferredoxin [Candidatus Lokiarchaeota archaeon]
MNVLILYFSATGNTAKIAKVINEKFKEEGFKVTMSDITPLGDRQRKINFEPYQGVVFGAPTHARRAPRVLRDWLRTLDGKGKKCSMFFTYGGFGVHPAHYSTREILKEQNFIVVSSADFLGSHTFNLGGWRALEDRPSELDFEVAKDYVELTCKRFTGEDDRILGELEKTEYTEEQLNFAETLRFKKVTQLPTRYGEECIMCLDCENFCPTGAMDAESGEADKEKCIACLGCVYICPEKVLKINDMSKSWSQKLDKEKVTEESIKEQKSKIYF